MKISDFFSTQQTDNIDRDLGSKIIFNAIFATLENTTFKKEQIKRGTFSPII